VDGTLVGRDRGERSQHEIAEIVDLPDGRHRTSDGAYVPSADVYAWSPIEERLGIPAPRSVGWVGITAIRTLATKLVLRACSTSCKPQLRTRCRWCSQAIRSARLPRTTSSQVDEQNIAAASDAVRASDMVLLGGGGLLHDHHGNR
jgi:hypothetical protein